MSLDDIKYMEWALSLPACGAELGTLTDGRVLRCESQRFHLGDHSVRFPKSPAEGIRSLIPAGPEVIK